MTDIQKYPTFKYPWAELEHEFISGKRTTLPIVGFGSLMNVDSARRNFPEAPDPAIPLRAYNFQRVYDYFIRTNRYNNYPIDLWSYQPCALNAYPSKNHWINGVELHLTHSLFEGFRQREKQYDLHPVAVSPFSKQSPDRVYYILSKSKVEHEIAKPILPHPVYHHVCSKGALDVSEEFLNSFHETTYFADRKTTIKKQITPHKELLHQSRRLL